MQKCKQILLKFMSMLEKTIQYAYDFPLNVRACLKTINLTMVLI